MVAPCATLNQTERLAGPRLPGSRPLAVAMLILRDEAFNRSNRARTGSGSAAAGAWYAHFCRHLEADWLRPHDMRGDQDILQVNGAATRTENAALLI
ncbi:hypothetical protein ASD03_27665 [Ensifer sp. Root127]|nr:hypothetical protein ASD03_27665 [Ensifer sp. Root127]